MATAVPARLTPAEGRKFGLVLGTAFAVLAAVLLWRGAGTAAAAMGVIGALLLLAGLLIPGQLGPVYRTWMGFALLLNRVTTPIFMSIVFYLVLTPVGLIKRSLRGNSILRPRADASYWVTRTAEHGGRRSDLERQF